MRKLIFLVIMAWANLCAQTPSGPAGGALLGAYPSPTLRDFVSASDYSTVQAACNAAGPTGMVIIPANYSGTDKTWNCGSTQVVNYMSYASTVLNAKAFGLRGDGLVIGDGYILAGSTQLTSHSYCFGAADVGKQVKLQGAGSGIGAAADIYTTIASTNACAATMATPAVNKIGYGRVFFGTDDTVAAQNMMNYANTLPQVTVYFPGGIYLINGTLRSSSAILIKGDGRTASILRQMHPTADLLILQEPTVINVPNGFAVSQAVKDIGLMGSGTGTTGALLIVAGQNSFIEDVSFFGHSGTAIQYASERTFFRDINARSVRRVFVTSPNFGANETYLQNFDFQDTGCVVDGELFNGTYYNYNINSVNGVYPSSGNLVQDQHMAVVLDGVTNFHIGYGSIKPTRCLGGIQVTETNGATEISHVYFENGFAGGYISPSLVHGGPHEKTTTAAPMAATDTVFDITDGSWFNATVGLASDLPLLTEGSTPGTTILLRPPDYVYGSTTPSTLGNGILQGSYEYVLNNGIVRDQTGSGWHHHGARAQNGTKALAWPAGTVYEQIYFTQGANLHLEDNHFNSGYLRYDQAGYTVTCDPNNEKTCGEIINGVEPDAFFAWGSPNQIALVRGLVFTGNNSMGANAPSVVAGNIEIHGSGLLDLKGQADSSNFNPISTSNNATLSLGALGSGFAVRAPYASGVLPCLTYIDGRTDIFMAAGPNNPGAYNQYGWSWQKAFGVGAPNVFGPLMTYSNGFVIGDPLNPSGQPNHSWQFSADTNGPGLNYKIWNNVSSSVPVFKVYGSTQAQVASNNGPWAKLALNLNSGTTPGFGMTLNNSLQLLSIATPSVAPTVTPTVATGTATGTYSYVIVSNQWDGSHTAASPAGTTAVGIDSTDGLSSTNFNTISWTAPSGFAGYYDIYRTSGGPNSGKLNSQPILTTSFKDTGLSGVGSAPNTNTTGCLLMGKTATNLPCGGKLDVNGDAGMVRVQSSGTTVEFSSPTVGVPTIQSDGVSLQFNVGGSVPRWTMNNTGNLAGVSGASLTLGTGSQVKGINYYKTSSITPAAVAAQSCAYQNISVSGMQVGDYLGQIVSPADLGNLTVDGRVSASNTLRLHFCNPSSSSVTPPGGVYSIVDFR
jgi:hypothetical protein